MPPSRRGSSADCRRSLSHGQRCVRAGFRQPLQLDRAPQLQEDRSTPPRTAKATGRSGCAWHRRQRRARDRGRPAHDGVDRARLKSAADAAGIEHQGSRRSTASTTRSNGARSRARRSPTIQRWFLSDLANLDKAGRPAQVGDAGRDAAQSRLPRRLCRRRSEGAPIANATARARPPTNTRATSTASKQPMVIGKRGRAIELAMP